MRLVELARFEVAHSWWGILPPQRVVKMSVMTPSFLGVWDLAERPQGLGLFIGNGANR